MTPVRNRIRGVRRGTEWELLMRKFAFVATAAALTIVAFGGWLSTTASVAPPVNGATGIDPMQMMLSSPNLRSEHFVDYSLVYP